MNKKNYILGSFFSKKLREQKLNPLFLQPKNSHQKIRNMILASLERLKLSNDSYQLTKTKILTQALLTSDLYTVIEDRSLEVYYQPLIDFQTNKIIGSEALLRWNHPQLGQISPLEFIPLAEETGLINAIGEWVLREACIQTKKWSVMTGDQLKISVNVSPYQFKKGNFNLKVSEILKKVGLNPESLTLELVESSLIDDFPQTQKIMEKLKKLNISIALDDFGTGYSSLGYLDRLSFDIIKIDKSFMKDIKNNFQKLAIVKGIISISKALNLKVTAEGLETKAEVNCLYQEGCDWAQGYFFSKPLPSKQFENLLREQLKINESLISVNFA
jgi:EAL domain-containing protein (putative c-di-GMP-specific phosphodiesterase class I)